MVVGKIQLDLNKRYAHPWLNGKTVVDLSELLTFMVERARIPTKKESHMGALKHMITKYGEDIDLLLYMAEEAYLTREEHVSLFNIEFYYSQARTSRDDKLERSAIIRAQLEAMNG